MKPANLGLEVTSQDLTKVLSHLFETNLERESLHEGFGRSQYASGVATALVKQPSLRTLRNRVVGIFVTSPLHSLRKWAISTVCPFDTTQTPM